MSSSTSTALPLERPQTPRVVLVYKRSLYDLYVEEHGDEKIIELLDEGDASVDALRSAHARHQKGLERVIDAFESAPVDLTVMYRGDLADHPEDRVEADLLVVVGGDGTLLDASHYVEDTPLLGINSDPQSSVGFLDSAVAAEAPQVVHRYLAGQLCKRPLARLEVARNGERVGPLVLNDVLFAHECPAAVTKYFLDVDARRESQVSSGLWVSTAAGSTAAIRSAGGERMSLDDTRLQYRVRELYVQPGREYLLRSGYVDENETLGIVSRVRTGRIYIDGPHIDVPIDYGDRIELRTSQQPLWQVCESSP